MNYTKMLTTENVHVRGIELKSFVVFDVKVENKLIFIKNDAFSLQMPLCELEYEMKKSFDKLFVSVKDIKKVLHIQCH